MLSHGTLLQSRYRIVRRIGQGGMGAVYEATHEELGHTVALKETLYQLLTNTVPAPAPTRALATWSGKADPLLPAYEVNPQVPPDLAGLLAKAMALNCEERLASAAEMRAGLAAVKPPGGKWGFIDAGGRTVIDFRYEDAGGFRHGLSSVKTGEGRGLVNRKGETVVAPRYEDIRWSENGLAAVKAGGLWGIIDTNDGGRFIVEPRYEDVVFKEDLLYLKSLLAFVTIQKKSFYIGRDGKQYYEP